MPTWIQSKAYKVAAELPLYSTIYINKYLHIKMCLFSL